MEDKTWSRLWRPLLFAALSIPAIMQSVTEVSNYQSDIRSTAKWTEVDKGAGYVSTTNLSSSRVAQNISSGLR